MKGLRVAGVKTLEQANSYLEAEFLPWWNQTLVVVSGNLDEAHRPLAQKHSLPASLSYGETRQAGNDYTIRLDSRILQIACSDIQTGLRNARVRVELRIDESIEVRCRDRYLAVTECAERPKSAPEKSVDKKLPLESP